MPDDSIPHPDAEFHNWAGPFSAYVATNGADMGLSPDDIKPLTDATSAWNTAYPAHTTAHAAASAATSVKIQARDAYEAVARPIIQQLQASPKVTDAQRKTMKLNVHLKTRTPASVPTTKPMATVDTSKHLQHTISFLDSTSSGSKRKPAGVASCEIWSKVGGPAPTDYTQMMYVESPTKTPCLVTYEGAQAGLTVWYWMRWVNTRNQKGPWSDPVSATIAG
jgi:hypothetical protein